MPSTLKDCAEFCHKYQRRRAPNGDILYRSLAEWSLVIIDAAKRNKLYTVTNKDTQRLIGICVCTEFPATKTIHVHDIVCVSNAFPTFIRECFTRWPEYRVRGNRFGKLKYYPRSHLYGR